MSRSFCKKTLTELTDSGVSVVSSGCGTGDRVMMWVAEGSDRLDRDRLDRVDRLDRLERLRARPASLDRDDRRREKHANKPRLVLSLKVT